MVKSARFADDTQRSVIVGRTGSGKTQAGLFQLSRRSYPWKPWIIFDYKGDQLIADLPTQEISIYEKPPREPGLYVVRPLPGESIEDFLWACWAQEHIGLYVDEGYMLGRNNPAFRALLTQGRSKNIPIIILSQRPVFLDVFVFSEADFYQVFALNRRADNEKVLEFMPEKAGQILHRGLSEYQSLYYDVGQNLLTVFKPVPDRQTIIDTFNSRIPERKREWV